MASTRRPLANGLSVPSYPPFACRWVEGPGCLRGGCFASPRGGGMALQGNIDDFIFISFRQLLDHSPTPKRATDRRVNTVDILPRAEGKDVRVSFILESKRRKKSPPVD
jgi:hypothetical protein